MQDVVRQEFADKLIATDEENKRVKQEMAELKSRHKLEMERMKQEVELVNKGKQEEMDAVHSRYVVLVYFTVQLQRLCVFAGVEGFSE